MVQPRDQLPHRDFFPPREHGWLPERPFLDIPQEGRFTAPPIHPRCLPVESALKDCAGLSVKEFALVVLDEHGDLKTYTSTTLTPLQRRIFTGDFKRDFRRCVQLAARGYSEDDLAGEFDNEIQRKPSSSGGSSSGGRSRRQLLLSRSDDSDDDDTATSGKRKRSRPTLYQKRYGDADGSTVPVRKTQRLVIGDAAAVEQLYLHRFMDMQQSSCKVMAKAFVKLVEPKKQSNHPYTKGNIKAPPWWPNTEGENHVTHREPDHLKKPERLRLLVHILRMIIEPRNSQCATVQKLGLNVEKLEQVTNESMKNWFKENPDNAAKKVYLKEIFRVARLEERYKNGEVDATTCVPVTPYGDKNRINVSDDEDPEEGIKAEEEGRDSVVVPATTPTSDSLVSPTTMLQSQSLQSHDPGEYYRLRNAPIRHYSQPQLDDHHPFGDGSYLPRGFQPESPSQQDPNRRGFPSSSYAGPPNLYDWQSSIVGSDPLSTNYYISNSPQPVVPQSAAYQVPPVISQHGMLPQRLGQPQFDIPNGRYDSAPALGNQLRTGSLHHPHQVPQDFQDYLHDGGAYGQHDPEMKDEHSIHSG